MKLLAQEIIKRLPKLYEMENEKDPLVVVKFFFPDFSWTWYGIEFDGQDTFYGYVAGDFPKLGYFSLSELKSNQGKLGCGIERDLYFLPQPLSIIRKLHE